MADPKAPPNLPPINTPVLQQNGLMDPAWYRYFSGQRSGVRNYTGGNAVRIAQLEAQLAAERAARIAADNALQGGITGSGGASTSNSVVFSGGLSSGASWVTIATVTLTPSGAGGDYTITVTPDDYIVGSLSDAGASLTTFNGNWRIREELTAGGTEYTLDSGVFTVSFFPETVTEYGEGGSGSIVFPAYYLVVFTGLPSGLIAANEGAQVDIRLEIQRASGTNEITAPGLGGSVSVVWTA
jgi:hypothetical protein